MTIYGDRVIAEIIKVKEIIGWDPNPVEFVSSKEEDEIPGMHVNKRKAMWGHSEKVAIYKSRTETSQEKPTCGHIHLGCLAPRNKRK